MMIIIICKQSNKNCSNESLDKLPMNYNLIAPDTTIYDRHLSSPKNKKNKQTQENVVEIIVSANRNWENCKEALRK